MFLPCSLQSLTVGLVYHRPEDPITYLQQCIAKVNQTGWDRVTWDTFLVTEEDVPNPDEKSVVQNSAPLSPTIHTSPEGFMPAIPSRIEETEGSSNTANIDHGKERGSTAKRTLGEEEKSGGAERPTQIAKSRHLL